jgi:hypothetical protein
MNRKLILALTLIFIFVVGVFVYLRVIQNQKKNTPTTVSGLFKSLLPFGSGGQTGTTLIPESDPLIIGTETDPTTSEQKLPRLRHYTKDPTSGHIIIQREKDVIKDRIKTTELGYYVRYIDRASGHIFESKTTDPNNIQKVSNTTIPKVYEAIFTPQGTSLLARFLDNNDRILSYYIVLQDKIPAPSSSTTPTVNSRALEEKSVLKEAKGSYLTPNIKEVAMSPNGTKILQSLYNSKGGTINILDGGKSVRSVIEHPLRDWLLHMQSETKATLTTKPSGSVVGYSYLLDIATGGLKKIVGGIKGLTVLPYKDSESFLVGEGGQTLKLTYFKQNKLTQNVPLKTLPEKCVWSKKEAAVIYCAVPNELKSANYPDDWYKGLISFTDSIWRMNLDTTETRLIADLPTESGQAIDVQNIQISNDDMYITFINKTDLTLWGLDLARDK